MLLELTLHTSLHLEVTPFSLALTHNGQLAFLGATVISHLQKAHSALLPWFTEERAGCLAVLNFGMWLRGPGRLVTPHLQYLRFLVMRTTRSLVEPLQVKGRPHKPCSEHTLVPCPVLQTWDMVRVAWRLLLTNCSCNFLLQKNNREKKTQPSSTRFSNCDFHTLARLLHSPALRNKQSDIFWHRHHF